MGGRKNSGWSVSVSICSISCANISSPLALPLGALVALLCAALGAPVWLQITLFVVVSGVLLALLWPLAKKFLNSKVTATNVDSVVGSVGRVTADIDNVEARGQVKLGGMEWTARSTSGDPISVGTEVRVDRVEGVKVYVTPVEAAVTV